MKFLKYVQELTGVSEKDAEDILKDIEDEVGHDENLIKAMVDMEKENLVKRLRKKKRVKELEESMAYR